MMDQSKLMKEQTIYHGYTSIMPMFYELKPLVGRAARGIIAFFVLYFIHTKRMSLEFPADQYPKTDIVLKILFAAISIIILIYIMSRLLDVRKTIKYAYKGEFAITTSRIIFQDIERGQLHNLDIMSITGASIEPGYNSKFDYGTVVFYVGKQRNAIYYALHPYKIIEIYYETKEKVEQAKQYQNAFIQDDVTKQTETNKAILQMSKSMEKMVETQEKILAKEEERLEQK